MQDKNSKKSTKLMKIVVSIIVAVLSLGGLATAFLINYNTFAPSTPIILDDGSAVYIQSSLNDNYVGYRFLFTDNNNKSLYIDNESNVLSMDKMLENGVELGERYKISVCYLAEHEGNNSEFSSTVEWVCQAYLVAPTLTLEGQTLSWNEVEGAVNYRIYVNNEKNAFYDTRDTTYDISEFAGGEKQIYVVAHSNATYLKNSSMSNTIEFTHTYSIKSFNEESIEFNKTTKTLTCQNEEELSSIDVYLEGTKYTAKDFGCVKVGSLFEYTIDLSSVYTFQTRIAVVPTDIDEYNKYLGEIVYKTI